jgi:hypothetical protein
MAVKVLIHPLPYITNHQATLDCSGSSVAELLESLEQVSCIKSRLCDEQDNRALFELIRQ